LRLAGDALDGHAFDMDFTLFLRKPPLDAIQELHVPLVFPRNPPALLGVRLVRLPARLALPIASNIDPAAFLICSPALCPNESLRDHVPESQPVRMFMNSSRGVG
jgi:hypothetical protein